MKRNITKNLDTPNLEGNLDNIIEAMINAREKYKHFDNLRIVEEYADNGDYYYYLRGDTPESDEQEALRIKREKEYEQSRLERDRRQYEALKAKFENQ
jgi:hypothetical protein